MQKARYSTAFVTVSAMLWALDAPFRKFLSAGFPSLTIVLMEHLLIACCVLPLFLPRLAELKHLSWKDWLCVAFVGFGGSASATALFTQSFHYLNPSVAILLQKLQPLVAIVLASVLLRETLSRRFLGWAAVAIGGAYLVSFPGLIPKGVTLGPDLFGVMLALGAAIFWGGSTVLGRFVLNHVSFQMMTSLRFLSGLGFLVVANAATGTFSAVGRATPHDWLFVFIIAILAGFLSLLLYYYGLRSTRASVATLCEMAFPLTAVVVNWVFLGASLSAMQLLGGAMLMLAIVRLGVEGDEDVEDELIAVSG